MRTLDVGATTGIGSGVLIAPHIVLKFPAGKPDPASVAQPTLGYEMDSTAGRSGGPIFRYHPDTQAVFFASVHLAGDRTGNTARRHDAGMRRQIETWLGASGIASSRDFRVGLHPSPPPRVLA